MRAVAVHPDVIVVTSRLWQTTCTAIRSNGEAMLVDSPYFPDELELLPRLLADSGFEPVGLLATHADFDHLLGRYAYPGAALGIGMPVAERLRAEPGVAQRELRDADAEHYVVRPGPLALGTWQALEVPGRVEIGDCELELHPAPGHTADGVTIHAPFADVLICGDYLSDVEIPSIGSGGSVRDYRATLGRLGELVGSVESVVPGHGSPQSSEQATTIIEQDLSYLDALERREDRPSLPERRDTRRQRAIHLENLVALGQNM